jgi:hypothetical protein
MASLQEIIDNAQFTDTMELTEPSTGTKFTLGDVRKFRGSALELERVAANKKVQAEQLATEAAKLLTSLQEQAKAVEANKAKEPPALADWEKDPWYAPVATAMKEKFDALNTVIAKMNEAFAEQKKALDNAQAIYGLERMRREFDAHKDDPSLKGKTFEDLAREAVNGRVIDQYGLPTLSPIISRLTEPDRIERAKKEAVDAARKSWEQEQAVAATTKPGAGRFRTIKPNEKPPISKIEELTSEMVANDPDVRAAMEGTAAAA